MGATWKRPGLLGLELLWRWSAGIPILLLAARAARGVHPDLAALQSITLLKPVQAVQTVRQQLAQLLPALTPSLRWFIPLALALWTTASALGRTFIYRRLDPALRPRRVLMGALGLIRAVAFLIILALWPWGLRAAARYTITTPAATGSEPNLVLFTAFALGLTLLLFVAWSLTVWLLDAAPLFAMAQPKSEAKTLTASLRAALDAAPLRSKLIEINLVMGIVRVCLLVLAMVCSASPIPFATVETQGLLDMWWVFTAVLFLVAADLFHVIRRAAYLALFRALVSKPADTTPAAADAS